MSDATATGDRVRTRQHERRYGHRERAILASAPPPDAAAGMVLDGVERAERVSMQRAARHLQRDGLVMLRVVWETRPDPRSWRCERRYSTVRAWLTADGVSVRDSMVGVGS
jgi:hypothetical protein